MKNKKPGDFTGLAENYSSYRPSYNTSVLSCIAGLLNVPFAQADLLDVGAGTGIWTRMLVEKKPRTIEAVEPNDDMRFFGKKDSQHTNIRWFDGFAESLPQEDSSKDLLTMASSFHWADFDRSTKEFARVLKPKGIFAALWNPRIIERNPILRDIEDHLYRLVPNLKRVSSGRSGITETLRERLEDSPFFEDVIVLQGEHTVHQTKDEYLGVWSSVNDIRAQAGEQKFLEFLAYIEDKIKYIDSIEVTYQTCAWAARRY